MIMERVRQNLDSLIDVFSPFMGFIIPLIGLMMIIRVVLNMRDFGLPCKPSRSDMDLENEEEIYEDEPEECEDDLSVKWACDYCGSVHRNSDSVCDACGGRRLRW